MVKPKVFITRRIPEKGIELLKEKFELEIWDKITPPPREVLEEKAREVDALVTLLTDKIDKEFLDKAERIRIIAQYAVGYDNIDVEYATKKGIYVTNTPGVLTDSTADLTFALLLAITRRIVESHNFVTSGEWEKYGTGWHPLLLLGMELKDKVLGVIGFGRIGRAVAKRARAFGMKIIYYDVVRAPEEIEKELDAKYVSLEELLKTSDVVTIHTPLTKETYHLLNEEKLRLMKPTAYLVNTARGAIIDTDALAKILREKRIAGAALDVFEQEPLPKDHPLNKLDNVILTPHIGSATWTARNAMAEIVAMNLIDFLEKRVPRTLVNKEVVNVRPPGF